MAKKKATAEKKAALVSAKVKFLKPLAPFAYSAGDVATIKLEQAKIDKAVKESFIEIVK